MDDEKRLIAREVPHLRRFAVSLTGDVDRADDLVQDAVERALKKRRSWRRTGSMRSWLFKLLYRVYLNSQARRRLERESAVRIGRETTDRAPATQEGHVEVLNIGVALQQLPADQREVVLLVGLEGLSYDEAAFVVGVPIGTIKSRLYRGREALHEVRNGTRGPSLRRVK
jgi:RNA polymerase sigma-70 factor (ECF subfamily)